MPDAVAFRGRSSLSEFRIQDSGGVSNSGSVCIKRDPRTTRLRNALNEDQMVRPFSDSSRKAVGHTGAIRDTAGQKDNLTHHLGIME